MAAGCVYGDRQIQSWTRQAAAQLPTSSGSDPRRGDHRHRASTHWRTATTHNARHQRARILNAFRECAQSSWLRIVKSGDFPVEFDEGDGLKNRRRFERKSRIRASADFTYT